MILDDTYLGGRVVGIGRKRLDGSFEYKELEEPIHNRIVSKGIDNLLTFQGDNDVPTDSGNAVVSLLVMPSDGSHTWGKGGVLTYSALGDSGDPTSFNDTNLHNRVTDITKNGNSGNPYCGMKSIGGRGEGFRVTHIHAIQNSGYIREAGWYKDVKDAYELFSRVVFDVPIEVTAGEELWITYELDITYPETTMVTMSTLLDREGNPLQAEKASTRRSRAATDSWSYERSSQPYPNFVCNYRTDGFTCGYVCNSNSGWRDAWWSPVWTWKMAWSDYYGYAEYRRNYPYYMTSANNQVVYTGDTNNQPTTQANVDATNIMFRKILDYTPGSYYRDAVITLGSDWPNMTTEEYVDVSQLILNGTSYRFGHYETDPETGEPTSWVPQFWRKMRGRMVALTLRQRYITPDIQA